MTPPPPPSTLFPYTTLFRSTETPHDGVVQLQKCRIVCPLFEPFRRDLPQKRDGVVPRAFPQLMIDPVKHFAGVELPTPPEVAGEAGESVNAFREIDAPAVSREGDRQGRDGRGVCHRV